MTACPEIDGGVHCIDLQVDSEGNVSGPQTSTAPGDTRNIIWRFTVANEPIATGITFYSDQLKQTPVRLTSYFDIDRNFGDKNWRLRFRNNVKIPEAETYYYSLSFKEYEMSREWDPTLVIEPRGGNR